MDRQRMSLKYAVKRLLERKKLALKARVVRHVQKDLAATVEGQELRRGATHES